MKSIETHGTFEDVIGESSDLMQILAHRLRDLIIEIYPNVFEVPWPKQKVVGYGIGPKKMSEHFSYIGTFRNHINLGFYYGSDLPDPLDLLEGTGEKFRHVKIISIEQLERPAIRRLLDDAVKERHNALGAGK